MKEKGTKNHHYTTPEGYTLDGVEGNLFNISQRSKKESYDQFRRIITPIINEHLRNLSDQRVKSLKREYFKEFFEKMFPK